MYLCQKFFMKKIFYIVIFITCFSLQAQFSIKGTIDPDHDYSWILLYKMQNGDQKYIDNADVVEGQFKFEINDSEPSGIYRAYYQIENSLYVEFIYNKEEVEFSFDPNDPDISLSFSQSKENNVYQSYYKEIRSKQQKIDSIQVLYFKSSEENRYLELEKHYKEFLGDLNEVQERYEKESMGMLANHFISASAQYNAESPHKDPSSYMEAIKEHFFDHMDLSDEELSHSTFVSDRLHDYVFYLNQAEDQVSENELQKDAIEKALQWIGDDMELLGSFESDLLEAFLLNENVEMINFVNENHYKNLPAAFQSDELNKRVIATLKTAIGITAPDFSWSENGTTNSLHALSGTDYYIVLFFSSNCPHCQMEIPEFYKFIIGIENIKVVAVGLEDEKGSWEAMTGTYNEFINILDLDKWSSQKVKDYGVTAIPTYFVLDVDKKILAKPLDFEELKSMFETR